MVLVVPQKEVVILAVPSKAVPFIFLATSNLVAAAATPDVLNLPSKAVCNPSTLLMIWLCESSATTAVIDTFPVPSNEVEPDTSPVNDIVLAVVNLAALDAVDAFPLNEPLNVGAVTVPGNEVLPELFKSVA